MSEIIKFHPLADNGDGIEHVWNRHPVDQLFDGIVAALKCDQRIKLSTLDLDWILRDVRREAEELFEGQEIDLNTIEALLDELRQEIAAIKRERP